MAVAHDVAARSLCTRGGYGAVIVSPTNRIVAVGYNGPPAGLGMRDTCAGKCPRSALTQPPRDYHDCFAIHAEANALLVCDVRDRQDGTIYVTGAVCMDCAKLLANSGLKWVVAIDEVSRQHRMASLSYTLLRQSGLHVDIVDDA